MKNKKFFKHAIVVPCYNEQSRFPFHDFLLFAEKNPDVLVCFVNDGSKDQTLAVLRGIQFVNPENLSVFNMPQNGGKSEAVRLGILYVYENFHTGSIGFLDADLATKPDEWLAMANYRTQFPQYGVIIGSRIQRLGATIERDDKRSLLSAIVKNFIRVILKAKFQDTQCGAKIFERHLIPFLFNKPFLTPWLFDIEIFLRLKRKFGKTTLQKGVLEFPLMEWNEIGDSKLLLKDSVKIPLQLLKLHYLYNISKKLTTSKGYHFFDFQNSIPSAFKTFKILKLVK